MESLLQGLKERLSQHSPSRLTSTWSGLREAAVLVPLFLREGVPHLLFTRRPLTLRTHAGQISFPGGSRDPEDESPLYTALRETHEELGIPPERVQVLGELDELPTVTRFRITPILGVIPPDGQYRPHPAEIDVIIEVPLLYLFDPAIRRVERWNAGDTVHDVYFYDYGPHVIWGATAAILKNFLDLAATLPELSDRSSARSTG